MAYSATYTFTTQAIANNGDWQWDSTDYADHTVQTENTPAYWCHTTAGTTSSGTGAEGDESTPFVYPETSSPVAAADLFTMTLEDAEEVDASDYELMVEFDRCTQGNTASTLYFDAWDGSTWNNIDSFAGDSTTTFTSEGPYDFGPDGEDYTNSDFKIRFRIEVGASGNAYQTDFAISTVEIYGEDAGPDPGAGMVLASATKTQASAGAEDPATFDFEGALAWGAISLAIRQMSGVTTEALAPTTKLNTIQTTGTVTVQDGATIDELTFNGDVTLVDALDLTDVTINGDLLINTDTGSWSLDFDNVTVTGDVNQTGTGDVTIAASNGSSLTEGTGDVTINNTVVTTITGVPSGAEYRIYEADATQGIIGSTELQGAESWTGGDITYNDNYASDTSAALQVLASGYVEYLVYFTLSANTQSIDVTLIPETNE